MLFLPSRSTLRLYLWANDGSMPLLALLASDSEMVPVGAIEVWCVKRAPFSAMRAVSSAGELLHVTAVAGEQHLALDLVADLVPVAAHLRTPDQHLFGDR